MTAFIDTLALLFEQMPWVIGPLIAFEAVLVLGWFALKAVRR